MNKVFSFFSLLMILNCVNAVTLKKTASFGGAAAHLLLGVALKEERGYACRSVYSGDGSRIYVGMGDHLLELDAETGKTIAKYNNPAAMHLQLSPDSKNILCASNGRIVQWNIQNRKVVKDLKMKKSGSGKFLAKYSRGGRNVIYGCADKTLQIYDLKSGAELDKINSSGSYRNIIGATEDENAKGLYLTLSSGRNQHPFYYYDYAAKTMTKILTPSYFSGYNVYVPAAGDTIVTSSCYWAEFFNRQTKKRIGRSRGFNERFRGGSCLPDGRIIANSNAYVYIIDPKKCDYTKKWLLGSRIGYVQASPGGKYFCYMDKAYGIFGQCRIEDGKARKNWKRPDYYAKYIQATRDYYVAVEADKKIVVRNHNGKILREIINKSGAVTSLAVSPDGKRLTAGSIYSTLDEYRIKDGKHLIKMVTDGHRQQGLVRSIKYFNDGGKIACAGDSGNIYIRRLCDGKIIKTFSGHIGSIFSLSISSDEKQIISSGLDQTVRAWNIESGKEDAAILVPGYSESLCYATDGQILAYGRRGLIKINLSKEEIVKAYAKTSSSSYGYKYLSVSPDAKYALLFDSKKLKICDLTNNNVIMENNKLITSAAFTAQGYIICGKVYACYDILEVK